METSRRSTTNLPHLSITPLNARPSPDTPSATEHDLALHWSHSTSYIAGKSAPTTPGILSRSSSAARLNSKSFTHLAFTPNTIISGAALSKSKSAITLPYSTSPVLARRRKPALRSARPPAVDNDDGEWLFRAGTAISSEARESKGQSWLVSRESSTSLVALDADAADEEDEEQAAFGAYELGGGGQGRVVSGQGIRASRSVSRAASRAASTRTSRRASLAGSRPDLTFLTPKTARTPNARGVPGRDDYFGELGMSAIAGPDFVDNEEEEEEDGSDDEDEELRERLAEAEVAKLAQTSGFGLGGLVDRFIGFSLFDVKEDGQDDEEEPGEEEREQRRQAGSANAQTARITGRPQALAPSLAGGAVESATEGEEDVEAQGGWSDAAWLLSVASKVLL